MMESDCAEKRKKKNYQTLDHVIERVIFPFHQHVVILSKITNVFFCMCGPLRLIKWNKILTFFLLSRSFMGKRNL